jgi:YidC/Oxa1 family membrane protein insertase
VAARAVSPISSWRLGSAADEAAHGMSMEKRAVLAAVLMALVFVAGQYLFFPSTPEAPPSPKADGRQADERASSEKAPAAPAKPEPEKNLGVNTRKEEQKTSTPVPQPPSGQTRGERPPQRLATVVTPLYRAVVSSEGGKLQELTLHYRGEKPMVIVGELGPGGLVTGPPGSAQAVPMRLSATELSIGPDRPTGDLVLSGEVEGITVTKTLTFHADTYTIDAKVQLRNSGTVPRQAALAFPWTTLQEWAGKTAKFLGQHPTTIAMSAGGELRYTDDLGHPGWHYGCLSTLRGPTKNGDQLEKPADPRDWIALGSNWYTAALIARTPGFEIFTTSDHKPADPKAKPETPLHSAIGLRAAPTIPAGGAWEGAFTVYAGPKEYNHLHRVGLDETINFGGFPLPRECGGLPMKWFAVPILLLMNWLYAHVHNYGVAIILLTVLSKVLFYPLTVWSMRSMKAMKDLQPQMNALRSKYKSDPQRVQRETMELYRKHGVNPVGGCLPMLPQIPIFYALYLAVANSAELQNAPFLCFGFLHPVARLFRAMGASWVESLWICNLADIDPLYILPLVMGVTMFVQQKMTPVSGDPAQAKVMLIMPVFFTIMFLNLPSGLVLYWTVSNVLQIAQQWWMNRPATPAGSPREVKNGSRA